MADGAIGFYCDHHVSARMSKFMYGVEYLRAFEANDPEHVARQHRLFEMPSGPKLLPDAFDCILARVRDNLGPVWLVLMHVASAERQSQGIHSLQQKVLHGSDESFDTFSI